MKKQQHPRHWYQDFAMNDIFHLHFALHEIHRGMDGDGVPTASICDPIGIDADGWTRFPTKSEADQAIEAVDWFLTDGVNWADHCGPLKPAFLAVLQQIKTILADTDWTPCRCKACTERRKKAKRD